jgi:hypothetical protein
MKTILFYTCLAALLGIKANAIEFEIKNIPPATPAEKITFSISFYPYKDTIRINPLSLDSQPTRTAKVQFMNDLKAFRDNLPASSKSPPFFQIYAEVERTGEKTLCGPITPITKDTPDEKLYDIDRNFKVVYDGNARNFKCSLSQ